MSASVVPNAATGTVTFLDGTTVISTVPVTAGTASGTFAVLLNAGNHSITAVYSGDASFAGSISAPQTLVVNKAPSTSLVTFFTPSPQAFGTPVTVTGSVAEPLAGGTMTLSDGTTVIATGLVSRGRELVFASTTLPVGNHVITSAFAGDANFLPSTSAPQTFVITQASGVVTLAPLAPAAFGNPVTFTATVTPAGATGTVTFKDGATTLGSTALSTGSASFTTSALGAGSHTITATYSGDANVTGGTSVPQTQVINQAASTAALAAPAAANFGAQVTFTATVSPTSATGTVTFQDGGSILGTSPLSAGSASFSTTALSVGSHSITASYSGDANFSASISPAVTQIVNPAPTTTSLPALAAATFGSAVSFTALVSPNTATGIVTFKDGTAALGTSPVSGGTAVFTTSALNAGSHSITAVYSGDASFTASTSPAQTQIINPAASSVTLTAAPNPSVAGAAVLLTATVTSTAGTPAGSVSFNDGPATIGTGLLNAGGVAVFSTTALTVGTHSLSAVYAANGNFAASSSAALTQIVAPAPDYSITSDKPSASLLAGQSATFNITTQSVNGFKGTVNFSCGSLPALTTCTFNPASVTVDATNSSVASTLTIKTTGKNAALSSPDLPNSRQNRLNALAWSLGPLGAGIVVVAGFGSRKRRARHYLLIGLMLVLVGITLAGCGGSPKPVPPPQTPDGTATIAVTASGTAAPGTPDPGHVSQTLNITITVSQ